MNTKILNIKKELEEIRKMNKGFITPEAVVEYAKSKKTVLHSEFCWDNDEAAAKYRIMQAGYLIRSVKVEIVVNEKSQEIISIREYVSLPNDRGTTGYRHITQVLNQDDLRLEYIESVKDEFLAIESKLKVISTIAHKKAQAVKAEIEKERVKVQNKIVSRAASA